MDRAELSTTEVSAPSMPMGQVWRTIRDFILWSHDRGTVQYDVMVTLILLFVFLAPRAIDFHDKPAVGDAHPRGVVVTSDGSGVLVYEVEGAAVSGHDDGEIRGSLLRIIEPISGEVSISKYEAVPDSGGHVLLYRVWVRRHS